MSAQSSTRIADQLVKDNLIPSSFSYTIVKGDTLANIPAKVFGPGDDNVSELANWLGSLGAKLTPGESLPLPGEKRDRVINALIDAEKRGAAAREQEAHQFAQAEYSRAEDTLKRAYEEKNRANYPRSEFLAKQASLDFDESVEQAGVKAVQKVPAKVLMVIGSCDWGRSDAGWERLAVGDLVEEGMRVRSGPKGRLLLETHDEARILLESNSEIVFNRMRNNQRTGRPKIRYELMDGSFLLDFSRRGPPPDHVMKTGGLEVEAVQKSGVRMSTNGKDASLLVDKGMATSILNGQRVALSENEALEVDFASGTSVKQVMPDPPVLSAQQAEVRSGMQKARLAWTSTDGVEYLIEVARDDEFRDLIEVGLTNRAPYVTQPLLSGDYFWQVRALTPGGLASRPSNTGRMSVDIALKLIVNVAPQIIEPEPGKRLYVSVNQTLLPQLADEKVEIEGFEVKEGNGEWRKLGSGPYFVNGKGRQDLHFRAVGLSGARGEATLFPINVDTEAPQVWIKFLFDMHPETGKPSCLIAADAIDPAGVKRLVYRVGDGEPKDVDHHIRIDRNKVDSLRFQAADRLGNISDWIRMSVDSSPP